MPSPTPEEMNQATQRLLLQENTQQKETIEVLKRELCSSHDRVANLESTAAHLRARLAQVHQSRFFVTDLPRDEDDGLYQAARTMAGQDLQDDELYEAARAMNARDLRRAEITLLRQAVEASKAELEKWKNEAARAGAETVSRSWQASVDEAVRREREKDAWAIRHMQRELEVLRKSQG
ncbi:hypothetical protein BDY17DRAFT_294625 [Neohortaea acidophila]|uniref:Uncharacterized protein n=1 Tax=Neohortaea acidophila TaxID=245834 RepID=A0A6A6PW59_9PEZI|nr:uncharacterized protein BDY17DRAFT_294625 [Neohortaea acidophila]KAF2483909.1 hypothetical protein BDY17DRAFT_294625 [Neohortaea acidophila]